MATVSAGIKVGTGLPVVGAVPATNVPTLIYTVPANSYAIISSINFTAGGGATNSRLYIYNQLGSLEDTISSSLGNNGKATWTGAYVGSDQIYLGAGYSIYASLQTNNGNANINGVEFKSIG